MLTAVSEPTVNGGQPGIAWLMRVTLEPGNSARLPVPMSLIGRV